LGFSAFTVYALDAALKARVNRIRHLRQLTSNVISEVERLRLSLNLFRPDKTDMDSFASRYHELARLYDRWRDEVMLDETRYPDMPTMSAIIKDAAKKAGDAEKNAP